MARVQALAQAPRHQGALGAPRVFETVRRGERRSGKPAEAHRWEVRAGVCDQAQTAGEPQIEAERFTCASPESSIFETSLADDPRMEVGGFSMSLARTLDFRDISGGPTNGPSS
jgi:predicted exporter